MMNIRAFCVTCSWVLISCVASGDVHDPVMAARQRLGVTLPQGWMEVPVDGSVGKDTIMVLHGPHGSASLVPVVQVARRTLTAMEQRPAVSVVLRTFMSEHTQMLDGFEVLEGPTPIAVQGRDAAVVSIKFTETYLGDNVATGAAEGVERFGKFYAVYATDSVWLIRCMGAANKESSGDFDAIVSSLTFG